MSCRPTVDLINRMIVAVFLVALVPLCCFGEDVGTVIGIDLGTTYSWYVPKQTYVNYFSCNTYSSSHFTITDALWVGE